MSKIVAFAVVTIRHLDPAPGSHRGSDAPIAALPLAANVSTAGLRQLTSSLILRPPLRVARGPALKVLIFLV
jgi:hypothetical protein